MKKLVSLVLAVLILIPSAVLSVLAEETVHTHAGALVQIMTENVDGIDFCGKFHCDSCGEDYYAPVTYEDVGMPIINISGSQEGMSKENEVLLNVSYSSENVNFTSAASFKWQGGTSVDFDKKNYTMKLLKDDGSKNKIKIVDEWGKQSKYCLKANWVDASHSRNIVSARIYNEIVHSRCLDDELEALPNGGAVDGFPVALYDNGQFYGLYTLNIPKDNWAWGMNDENLRQALLFGGSWTESVRLNTPIADVNDPAASGFDIEYCSTEDDPEVGCTWAVESFNNFINFLRNTTNQSTFRSKVGQYTSVERAIDVLIFSYFIHADDNLAKNIVWATYDGTVWIPCMYDMDATWGLFWDGTMNVSAKGMYFGGGNLLFNRLLSFYSSEIEARYTELRKDIFSRKTIEHYFTDFFDSVTDVVRNADAAKWPGVPSRSTNNYNSIYSFATTRMADYDNHYFGTSVKENTRWDEKVSFNTTGGCKFYVYPYEDYTVQPTRSIAAYPVDSTGAVVRKGNEVNFLVVPPEGMLIDSVSVRGDSGYSEILGPDDTGAENVYRIVEVSDFIDVDVALSEIPSGYDVTFDACGNADIYVFPGSDYTASPVQSTSTVSVDSSTGVPTKSGDGQVNFMIVPHNGYTIGEVTVSPANYKNLKTPDDTENENTYRITKITGDLTVTVTLIEGHVHNFIFGRCIECFERDEDYTGRPIGDIDGDEKITAKDTNLLKKAIVGAYLITGDDVYAADVYGDGKLTVGDVNQLKKLITGSAG